MIGGRLAIPGEGRVSRDRFDPQQREQPLQAVVEIGIDVVEDFLRLGVGHLCVPCRFYGVAFSSAGGVELAASGLGGCRRCQTSVPAMITVATKLFPQACRSLGNTGNDSNSNSPTAPSASQVQSRTLSRGS